MILECPSCEHGISVDVPEGKSVVCGQCGCRLVKLSYVKHYLARAEFKMAEGETIGNTQ